MDIEKAAVALRRQAYFFTCSYKTAWEKWMHPAITDEFTFEEVMKQMEDEGIIWALAYPDSNERKYGFDINGSVHVNVDEDQFNKEFIEWIESKGWAFAGVIKPTEESEESE